MDADRKDDSDDGDSGFEGVEVEQVRAEYDRIEGLDVGLDGHGHCTANLTWTVSQTKHVLLVR